MQSRIVKEAPGRFDQQFLQWVHQLEDLLLIKLADWFPSSAEEVRRYAKAIHQSIPEDLKLYYENAYPFGSLRDGWRRWHGRQEEYRATWIHSLVDTLGVGSNQAETLVNGSAPLWPIYCLEKKRDVVGFVWNDDEIAVIELDLLEGGRGKPIAIGLRNYFLASMTLELLAEDKIEVDFDKLRQHPTVLEVSGWPTKPPLPEHIALTLEKRRG